jgi:hypothetical protein
MGAGWGWRANVMAVVAVDAMTGIPQLVLTHGFLNKNYKNRNCEEINGGCGFCIWP